MVNRTASLASDASGRLDTATISTDGSRSLTFEPVDVNDRYNVAEPPAYPAFEHEAVLSSSWLPELLSHTELNDTWKGTSELQNTEPTTVSVG